MFKLVTFGIKKHGKTIGVLLPIIAVLLTVGTTLRIAWHATHPRTPGHALLTPQDSQSKSTIPTTSKFTSVVNSPANTKTYIVPSSSSSMKISIPASSKIEPANNVYAAVVTDSSSAQSSIYIRTIYLTDSTTPAQEWNSCPSADACGPDPRDSKVEEGVGTINGLSSYSVKMKSSSGIYHATVVKGAQSKNGTSLFTEFIIYADNDKSLAEFNRVVGSVDTEP